MRNKLHVFLFSIVLSFFTLTANSKSACREEIKQTAIQLYNSFDKMQHMSGRLAFNDSSRSTWNNLSIGLRARVGASIGNMKKEQRKLIHRILSVSLSSQGYLKATSIMHLDDLLNQNAESTIFHH